MSTRGKPTATLDATAMAGLYPAIGAEPIAGLGTSPTERLGDVVVVGVGDAGTPAGKDLGAAGVPVGVNAGAEDVAMGVACNPITDGAAGIGETVTVGRAGRFGAAEAAGVADVMGTGSGRPMGIGVDDRGSGGLDAGEGVAWVTGSAGGRDAIGVAGGSRSAGGLGNGIAGVEVAAGEGTRTGGAGEFGSGIIKAGGVSEAVRTGLTGIATGVLAGSGGDDAISALGDGVVLTGANSGTAGGVVMSGFGRGLLRDPRGVEKGLNSGVPYGVRVRVAGLGPGGGKPHVGLDNVAGGATDS